MCYICILGKAGSAGYGFLDWVCVGVGVTLRLDWTWEKAGYWA